MGQYLYGAAVQGIQSFIFQTNELKDIVGASELVENICTELFAKALYEEKNSRDELIEFLDKDDNAVLNAAGNIKYIFNTKEDCEKIVRDFPKRVVEYAPGITISQAVVEIKDPNKDFEKKVNELENLLRIQRNKPMQSTTIGLMGVLRSRKTNLPVVDSEIVKGERLYYDAATLAKRYDMSGGVKGEKRTALELAKDAFGKEELQIDDVAIDIEDMVDKNNWIAIIHADGNGLGQVVQKIGKDRNVFRGFSKDLDKATKKSAVEAFEHIEKHYSWKNEKTGKEIIPIRPIVLGGDDFTVVCRADLAIEYVTKFIDRFEKNTEFDELKGVFLDDVHNLSACAGISFIKSSYPFYYGYSLAEALCSRAKKDAKMELRKEGDKSELPKSCIMFHKVQDSFVEDFNDIANRELKPQPNITFEFGPYYVDAEEAHGEKRWKVETLLDKVKLLDGVGLKEAKKGNAVKSHLRNWLSLLHDNPGLAEQKLIRLKELLNTNNADDIKLREFVNKVTATSSDGKLKTPVYDILSVHTIFNQETRRKETER